MYPHPADRLAGLPAAVPDDLPGPPAAAQGPAVGAQQPRRQRAQRAGRMVAAAAGPAHRAGRRRPAGTRLDQRGVRRPGSVRGGARPGPAHGRAVRGGRWTRRGAGRGGADGGLPGRTGSRCRAGSTGWTSGRGGRTGGGGLQDGPAAAHHRRRPDVHAARAVRARRRRGCCGGPATGSNCTTCRPGRYTPGSTRTHAGPARWAGPRTSPPSARPPTSATVRAATRGPGRGLPAESRARLRLVRFPRASARRAARRPRRGVPGTGWPADE